MRLFDAIIEANHRAVSGDTSAGLHPADYADELPVIALTCIDPRLNPFFPNALALPSDQFIWLRNAGNIIFGPMSSMTRAMALACAIKGGREIAIIGHTDCQVCKTTPMQLIDKLKALGIDRQALPEDINDFFGMFNNERQNVIKAVDIIRHSPLIGPKIPVQGLLMDTQTGKLDWIVNGYEVLENGYGQSGQPVNSIGQPTKSLGGSDVGGLKFPEAKIGDTVTKSQDWLSQESGKIGSTPGEVHSVPPVGGSTGNIAGQIIDYAKANWPQTPAPEQQPASQPKIPIPPPIRIQRTKR